MIGANPDFKNSIELLIRNKTYCAPKSTSICAPIRLLQHTFIVFTAFREGHRPIKIEIVIDQSKVMIW